MWSLLTTGDAYSEFPMNHIAYSLIEQNDEQYNHTDDEHDSELQRIENKVNLILKILGQMMHANSTLPDKARVKLGAEELAWYNPEAKVDQYYQTTLYLNEDHCVPIKMIVKVNNLESGWCHARIEQQRLDEQSAWERWVFRQHRRNVAIARAQSK